jgi:signal transduction histidine kinase
MEWRAVITDPAGVVRGAAVDLWSWLRHEPPRTAQGDLLLADVVAALAPGMAMQAIAMDDGTTTHIIRRDVQAAAPDAVHAALAQENLLLRETLDAVDGSISLYDSNLCFRIGNKAYRERYPALPPASVMTGWYFGDAIRYLINIGFYIHPRAASDPEGYIAERVADLGIRENRVFEDFVAATGQWTQTRIRWTPSDSVVTLNVDITENKRLAEEVTRGQRMKTVGRIAGGVAHHFNNLLTVICANLDLLLGQPDLSPRGRDLAGRALAGAEHGGKLTRQLLTFVQRDITRPRQVDVNLFLDGITALLQGVLGPLIALDMRLDETSDQVSIDPAKFETAMMNLVLNAREAILGRKDEATAPPGRVVISTFRQHEGDKPLRVIAVRDNGEGMTPEVAAEAFEPFFTTRHMSTASGLGLSQVHGFAAGAGGDAKIISTPGEGTTVEIRLPLLGA